MVPAVTFSSRIKRRTSVDLPAPLGPTRKTKSCLGISIVTSRRATVPFGYFFSTPCRLICGAAGTGGTTAATRAFSGSVVRIGRVVVVPGPRTNPLRKPGPRPAGAIRAGRLAAYRALQCGAHGPHYDPAAAAAPGGPAEPLAVFNNCSGKHAGMLAAACALNVPLETYLDPAHPLQERIRGVIATFTGCPPAVI